MAGRRRVRERPVLPLLFLAGAAVVPAVFTLTGFDWWEGYRLLVVRYHQGVGGTRPYGYWVGQPGVHGAGHGRGHGGGAAAGRRGPRPPAHGAPGRARVSRSVVAAGGGARPAVADLSGMSKAETERIWLPFAMWLLPAGALLPGPRAWLAAQAVLALLLNHLLFTGW